ncbi:MAG: class I SAM-dependent methyltransferase, partial [Bryobacteraceae bacterium]
IRAYESTSSSRILELGCGPGLLACDLAGLGYAGVGVDAAPTMIEISQANYAASKLDVPWSFQLADVEALPFPNDSFTAVTAAGVIEYMPGDERMLSEVRRVLKPRGILILNVTNRFSYSGCLNALLNPIKSLRFVQKACSPVRRLLAQDGQGLNVPGFSPRRHRPGAFRSTLVKTGFRVVSDRYLGFSVFPAPLCTLTSRVTGRVDATLDILDQTPLRYVGSCYLVTAEAA